MSTVTAISFKPKATRKRLKKEILSDDFKKWKILWKNIAENFLWKIFHLTSLYIQYGSLPYVLNIYRLKTPEITS
jgi:hypothetical protein